LAGIAEYSYSKGGALVNGPSIHLIKACAQAWGNIQFGLRELDQRDGVSSLEAFAWDLETNVKETKIFQVPHLRVTKNSSKVLTDPRDIYELCANNGSRRLRACIESIIPGDVIEAAQTQCAVTLKANADISPESIKKMITTFKSEFGVSKEMIEKRMQCRIEAIRPAQFIQLKKIYTSIKDAMSKASDWFENVEFEAYETSQVAPSEEAEEEYLGPWPLYLNSDEWQDAFGVVISDTSMHEFDEEAGLPKVNSEGGFIAKVIKNAIKSSEEAPQPLKEEEKPKEEPKAKAPPAFEIMIKAIQNAKKEKDFSIISAMEWGSLTEEQLQTITKEIQNKKKALGLINQA